MPFLSSFRAAIVARVDGWMNTLTGVGVATGKDKLQFVPTQNEYLDVATLENLYNFDGIAARIVDAVPKHALRHGFTVTTGDAEADTALKAALDAMRTTELTRRAWTWARLYGGGALYLGADDGRRPNEPLDERSLRAVRWIVDVDRRDLVPLTYETDTDSPAFGTPRTYTLTRMGGTATQTLTVHASRLIRFDGVTPTRRRRLQLQGWGDSVLQRVYAELQQARGAFSASGVLLQEASQGVLIIKDLMEMMASDDEADTMKRRLMLMDQAKSVARSLLLDADGEDYKRVDVGSLTGVVEVLDRMVNFVAAVSGIPVTVLMGQAPAGLNATGDSDVRNWYDEVQAERVATLTPRLGRLARLVLVAREGPTGGVVPGACKVDFPPLYQMTPVEQADLRSKVATTDQVYVTMGAITPEEVATSRFRPEGWSMETTIDLDARAEAADDPGDESDDTKTDASKGPDADAVAAVIARVAGREIPRDAGVAILVTSLHLSAEDAERVMGEAGRSFFTKADPAATTELDSLREQHAALQASHRGTQQMLTRVLEKNRNGELVIGSPIARAPTATEPGDVLEEGDVIAVGDARALLRADGDGRGVAVVLPVPADVAARVAIAGGELPQDLHLTLAYFGPRDGMRPELLAAIRAVVATWAAAVAPIPARFNGIGRFLAPGDAPDPVYLSADAPNLSSAREVLLHGLAAVGVVPSKEHGFVPHVTVNYAPKTTAMTLSNERSEAPGVTALTFTEVAVWSGDARESFPLAGASAVADLLIEAPGGAQEGV